MQRTPLLRAVVSTKAGMRVMLSESLPADKYIKLAVDSGIFRDRDFDGGADFLKIREAPDGRVVEDYPIEYHILKLHPPHPYTPPPSATMQRRIDHAKKPHQTQVLMKKRMYQQLKRQKKEQEHTRKVMTTTEYYERLFGMPPPSASSEFGNKTDLVQKSYAFAVKQWQIMREDGVSEEESLSMVQALIEKEQTDEKQRARRMSNDLQYWRRQKDEENAATNKKMSSVAAAEGIPKLTAGTTNTQHTETNTNTNNHHKNTIPSIFFNQERTISAMTMWSSRLRSIPYVEWSIGAAVALDHWVARSVLKLSEDSWQALLEGNDPSLLSRGNDVIVARQALFPETILRHDPTDDDDDEDGSTGSLSMEKSIEELMQKLGMADDPDDSEELSAWKTNDKLDQKVAELVEQLQDWREKHRKVPYELWNEKQQAEFDVWLRSYVSCFTDGKTNVDYDATRKTLLSQPPLSRNKSDAFWTQIKDEADAEVFLQQLHKDRQQQKPQESSLLLSDLFFELPYSLQLKKLVDLSTLRPILDEYSSETHRRQFIAQYGHRLLEGVLTDYLIPDENGPIHGRELGRYGEQIGISGNERFRMEKLPYGSQPHSNESIQGARMLFKAWNEHKVGRAKYEEYLFRAGKLGLTYKDITENKK